MIPITKPQLGDAEADAARRVILSGWTTQGPEVAAFEREFAEFVEAPYACAVSNCTTALHLALLVLGVRPGDEVITVSHSFIATANVVRHCGATPVFVDIESSGFNIDPARIEAAVTQRTRAILCVHQVGMPCNVAAIMAISERTGLPVIEDAACAVGSEILWNGNWEKVGRPHAHIACFSLHPRKVISTGDGGMITTANPSFDERFRLLRQHGMSVSDSTRHGATKVTFESYPIVGYNYRMTDIQAAVGREQVKRLPQIVARRRALAARYTALLSSVVQTPSEPSWARSNWQSYCIGLPDHVDQRGVMQSLLDEDIASRRGIMCSHREAAYSDLVDGVNEQRLRNSERAQDRTIILPLFPDMTSDEQDRVVDALKRACCA